MCHHMYNIHKFNAIPIAKQGIQDTELLLCTLSSIIYKMATYRRPAVQSKSREGMSLVIQCPVCFNIYTNPKQFPCGHTLCLACVQDILHYNGVVICPECRAAVNIPDGGPTNLPRNIFLHQYLDSVRNSEESDTIRPNCYPCEVNGKQQQLQSIANAVK